MNFDSCEFGSRLQNLRKSAGMTQEKLAEQLLISWDYLSRLERGKRNPSLEIIIALAEQFHVSTDYLLLGKETDRTAYEEKLLALAGQLQEIAAHV